MVSPDGGEFPLTGSYLDLDENRLLVVGMDVPGKAAASTTRRRNATWPSRAAPCSSTV